MTDDINAPPHYTTLRDAFDIDVIDLIEEMNFGYHLGNVVKYLFRHEYKGNPIKDLRKAAWYLERHIGHLVAEEELREECERIMNTPGVSEEHDTDPYGRPLRSAPAVNIYGEEVDEDGLPLDPESPVHALYVHTPSERVGGTTPAAADIKNDYYEYNPDEVISYCRDCDEPIYRDDIYVQSANTGLDYCSTSCKERSEG